MGRAWCDTSREPTPEERYATEFVREAHKLAEKILSEKTRREVLDVAAKIKRRGWIKAENWVKAKAHLAKLKDDIWYQRNSPGIKACNHCKLAFYKKWAKRQKKRCSILAGIFNDELAQLHPGGVSVYIHPREVTRLQIRENPKQYEEYFISWMAEVGEGCCC